MNQYIATTQLPVSAEAAFAYHERPGALQRLIPPWEDVEIEKSDHSLTVGSEVVLKNKIFKVPVRWLARHTKYEPPHLFADTQVSGPFQQWDHVHRFETLTDHSSQLTDQISYQLPGGFVGRMLGGGKARRTIESMFAYRHRITTDDLTLKSKYDLPAIRVAVSGSSGMVGGSLSSLLSLLGHDAVSIVRSPSSNPDEIFAWGDDKQSAPLNDVDCVVHLAGKSIAGGRWNQQYKKELRDSRVPKTRQLCERLARLERGPSTLICASAIGIYGDRDDEFLSEKSSPGDDFLADLASDWEQACQPAVDAGIRVVNVRFGIILSPTGGALEQSLLPAKLFGGKLGSGDQWWSWVGLDDAVGAIYHCIATPSIDGPVNVVAPRPVRNAEFATTLADVISRKALVPAPAFALRAALGELADDLLLASTRVQPTVLNDSGYQFRFADLESQLRYCLGVDRRRSES